MPKKPNKKNRRMWSGIKPGDENFTSIPANIGLSEEQLKWEGMSFWQRAQKSEYFQREGKEHWLRACILLNSEEDFRIAYKMGPPDIYTNETLRTSDLRRRRMTIDSLTKMHPEIIFPKPLQNIQPEPLGPLYGVVMLKDLAFDQLLLYVQSGTYFYPDTPTDEINEMVQQFKKSLKAECRNWNESMASEGTGNKAPPPPPQTTNVAGSQKDAKNEAKKKSEEQGEEMLAQRVHPPSIFGGILRQKSSPMKPKKNVRWANQLMISDGSNVKVVASGYQMVDNENVCQAMDAPLDDDGWDDF